MDYDKINAGNAKQRRKFRQWEFEPYKAPVVVNGEPKTTTINGSEVSSPNGMFPREYDATAVLRSISQAYWSRNTSDNRYPPEHVDKNGMIISHGVAPMLDGGEMMVQLHLHPDTYKIVGAHPTTTNNGKQRMSLTGEEIHDKLFN